MKRSLHDYQQKAVRELLAALAIFRSVLFVLPGGGGKTRVAGEVIEQYRRAGKRVVVVVHRVEHLEQMFATLTQDIGLTKKDVGIVRGADERVNRDAPIQVCSLDTLNARSYAPEADLVVVDEGHHAAAPKWQRLLSWYPEAKILGLTATPFRFDRMPLSAVYETFVEGPEMRALFQHPKRPLTEAVVYVPSKMGVSLKGLTRASSNGRDYSPRQLGVRMGKRQIVGDVIGHLLERAKGKQTIVFVPTVECAKKYRQALADAGEPRGVVLTGMTPEKERRELLRPGGSLARGDVMYVFTCEVLTEGWDLPSVKCVAMARPTASTGLYLQMVARCLRTWKPRGQPLPAVPVVLDFAGNVRRHNLPWAHRPVSLNDDGSTRMNGKAPMSCWRCEACGRVNEMGAAACVEPGCEGVKPLAARTPEERDGMTLRPVVALTPEEREALIARVVDWGKTKGVKVPPTMTIEAFAEKAVDAGVRL